MRLCYLFWSMFMVPIVAARVAVRWVVGLFAIVGMCLFLSGEVRGDDGWTYARGFWFYNGVPYSEEQYQEPYTAYYYDAYGCYRSYTAYRTKTYYKKVYVQPGQGAINQMLAIAAARDQTENYNRKLFAEAQQLDMVADTLGMKGNFRLQNYGLNYGLGGYMNSLSGSYSDQVQTGSTLYARYKTVEQRDSYGAVDLTAIELRRLQALDNSTLLSKEINAGTAETARINADGAARVAEFRARGQLAMEIWKATEPQPRTTTRTEKYESVPVVPTPVPEPKLPVDPGSPTDPKLMAPTPDDQAAFLALPPVQGCIKCHGAGGDSQKTFNILTYHPKTASRELRRAVFMYGEGASKCTGKKLKAEDRVLLVIP